MNENTRLLAARTTPDRFATATGLREGYGFVTLAPGWVGGLYPLTMSERVLNALTGTGAGVISTPARTYKEGMRKLSDDLTETHNTEGN